MTLFAGFQPRLVLTASANTNRIESIGLQDEVSVSVGVGIFLDLPHFSAEVEMLHNVSNTCNGTAPTGETNTYVQVKPAAAFSFNSEWDLGINLPSNILDYSAGNSQDLYSNTVSLERIQSVSALESHE